MAQLDIQPIDSSQDTTPKLDIQPLDIQPVEPKQPTANIGDTVINTETGPKSLTHMIWDKLNTPLTTAPSDWAKSISDYITDPNQALFGMHETGQGGVHDALANIAARVRGFEGGMVEGAGNILTQATSPVNLAAIIATGGEEPLAKAGFGTAARGLNLLGKAIGIPIMAHGTIRTLDPNASWSDRAMGLTEVAGGGTAFLHKPASYAGSFQTEPKLAGETPDVGLTAPPMHPNAQGLDIKFFDKFDKYRQVPVGTKYTVSPSDKLPMTIKDAKNLGFEYQGLDDSGKLIIQKIRESPQIRFPEGSPEERSIAADVINLPRTLMASMDMSAPLRQGLGLIHKKAFWTALPDMFKAFGSEEFYDKAMESMASDPLFRKRIDSLGNINPSFAEEAGLKLTNLHNLSDREESIMSSLVDKVPGLGSSERAYTLFLNKLRADTFKEMVTDYSVFGGNKPNMPLAKEIATFVNTASGRGDLGKLEPSAKVLSSVFFSPRLIASRLGMMAKGGQALFSPEVYMLQSPSVRREYLKSLFAIAGSAGTFATLMKLAGASVEMDPASSDFGKVKFGNTRLDPYGGFQQYIVLAQRMMPELDLSALGLNEIGGKMKSTTTGREYSLGSPRFGESTRSDILIRFLRSKTNPIINFGWGLMAGQKEISGQKMDLTTLNPYDNAIAQRFLPMLTQDIYDLIKDNETPDAAKALAAGSAWFGMGSQTYGNR